MQNSTGFFPAVSAAQKTQSTNDNTSRSDIKITSGQDAVLGQSSGFEEIKRIKEAMQTQIITSTSPGICEEGETETDVKYTTGNSFAPQ